MEDASKTRFELSLLNEGQEPVVIQAPSARLILDMLAAFAAIKPVPISNLPFVNQGVLLDRHGKVVTLFKESPLGQTRLQPGDAIWGVDKDSEREPDAEKVSAQLEQLAPGRHMLYVVTAKAPQQHEQELRSKWSEQGLRSKRSNMSGDELDMPPIREVLSVQMPSN